MNRNRVVFILDPEAAEFRCAELPDLNVATIKQTLGYDAIDTIKFDEGHTLYYNDNGLQRGISHYIRLSGYPDPIVGRILLASSLGNRLPGITAEGACARFALYKPVMDPVVTTSRACNGDHTTFISVVERFDTRIELFRLEIVNAQVLTGEALPH